MDSSGLFPLHSCPQACSRILDTSGAQKTSWDKGRCPWQTSATEEQTLAEPNFKFHPKSLEATTKYLKVENSTLWLFHLLLTDFCMPNTMSCAGDTETKKIKLLPVVRVQGKPISIKIVE